MNKPENGPLLPFMEDQSNELRGGDLEMDLKKDSDHGSNREGKPKKDIYASTREIIERAVTAKKNVDELNEARKKEEARRVSESIKNSLEELTGNPISLTSSSKVAPINRSGHVPKSHPSAVSTTARPKPVTWQEILEDREYNDDFTIKKTEDK